MCHYNVSVAEVCVIATPVPQTFNETDPPGNVTKEPSPFLFKYFNKQTFFLCCLFVVVVYVLLFFLFVSSFFPFFFFFFLPYFVVGGGGGDDDGGVNHM